MSFAEKAIKEHATNTPERYAGRVRWQAFIYFGLNVLSVVILVLIIWRVQFFVTLSQRSNVETLALAFIFALAIYYLATTFKGFVGAVRMFILNSPILFGGDKRAREHVEDRKQSAIKIGGEEKYVCFDCAVRLKDKPDEPIQWELADDAGKLGELEIEGVKATYHPIKDGMNDGLFEFLADQLQNVMQKQDLNAKLEVVQWSSVNEDQATSYHSMAKAFQNLEEQLQAKKPIWPTWEISAEDVKAVGKELNKLIPALRNESLLPNLDYEVEYSVPIVPEPLGFFRLVRHDSRADPLISMGCAGFAMLVLLLLLTLIILFPPWVPGR